MKLEHNFIDFFINGSSNKMLAHKINQRTHYDLAALSSGKELPVPIG